MALRHVRHLFGRSGRSGASLKRDLCRIRKAEALLPAWMGVRLVSVLRICLLRWPGIALPCRIGRSGRFLIDLVQSAERTGVAPAVQGHLQSGFELATESGWALRPSAFSCCLDFSGLQGHFFGVMPQESRPALLTKIRDLGKRPFRRRRCLP